MVKKITEYSFYKKLETKLSSVILPGFHGVSLFDSLSFFVKEIFSAKFALLARSISFSFLLSLPPFLLFLFSLIPYLPLSSENIIQSINESLGLITHNAQLKNSISALLQDFFLHKKDVLLSFTALLTLWYSSNGMLGLMNSFDRSHSGFIFTPWYKKRLWAVFLTILFNGLILLAFALMIGQQWLFEILHISNWVFVTKLIEILIMTAALLFIVALIYKYGPATASRWPMITPGALLACFLLIVVTLIFFNLVTRLVNYNQIYGSVGTLIMFLAWLFFVSQILLIGFELNVSIFVNKELQNEKNILDC